MVRIALDLMSGDRAPEEILEGALLSKNLCQLVVIGTKSVLEKIDGVEKIEVEDFLPMDVKPMEILHRKTSSMYVGLKLVKEKLVDAFVCAGNTGALLAGATFVVGRMEGVERPALAVPVPSTNGFAILIDAGANARVRPEHLLDFAIMGLAYAKVLGKDKPKLGLLNVGEEENKGDEVTKEAYKLLKELFPDFFIGNVEGHDINAGKVDVVVADGFSGNVAMKTMEGTAKMILQTLKEKIENSGIIAKLGALLMKKVFLQLKTTLDPRTYGGAFILGIDGIVVKAHGSSDRVAIKNAIEVAVRGCKMKLVENIKEEIKRVRNSGACGGNKDSRSDRST
ncbi:phosphate acyltransferase PlsX [Pseudothermotoga thermarum]|uniref:Phosphate acyltransferase n=1 Tax=Pseudothermotoga thermarum DSM 5069 TaxID=688269 RepID=F7YU44_9THEM|nr:phosphate acyltransferase PlsX [Pseudothermotoga thermarum]AEH50140.1 phosphate:acyl-(acyl carrier protein) acyltransferase [Pseudothermotoga thermarum DSM 5069]